MPDFFISYTSTDATYAKWIVTELENAGCTTVSQVQDFRAGHDFVHEMHRAVASAKRTIAVLSPAYLTSKFGEAEWRAAFVDDPSGELGKLVLVKVQACEPTGLLRARVHIDLVGVDAQTARSRLLDGVRRAPAGTTHGRIPFPGATARRRRQRLVAGLVAITVLLIALATSTAWALSSATSLPGRPSAAGAPTPVATPTDAVPAVPQPAPPSDASNGVSGGAPAAAPRVDRPLGGPLIEVAPQVTIPPLKITTGPLPPIALGEGWSAQLEASGGVAPYTWSLSDALPVGIDLDENAGRLAGTPTVAGDAAFTITVEDSRGVQATRRFELSVPKPRLPGDINRDGAVDCTDLNALRAQWNETGPDLEGDLNDDDTVDLTDMSILLSNWSGDENSSTC